MNIIGNIVKIRNNQTLRYDRRDFVYAQIGGVSANGRRLIVTVLNEDGSRSGAHTEIGSHEIVNEM